MGDIYTFGSKITISVLQNFHFRFTSGEIRRQKKFQKNFIEPKDAALNFRGSPGGNFGVLSQSNYRKVRFRAFWQSTASPVGVKRIKY